MPWFMNRIKRGIFEIVNPFNRQTRKIQATPAHVHTIVFWSKDFGLFLKESYGEKLQNAGYNLFFNFTVNSSSPELEPHVPSLNVRMDQIKQLCDRFGSRAINWRFDPICFYEFRKSGVKDNLDDLNRIADRASENGIRHCITSFMDPYSKIKKRLASMPDFSFSEPPLDKKKHIILKMEQALADYKINLRLCCEKEVLDTLPKDTSVSESSCIPNDLLVALFGGTLSLQKDRGQRTQKGCGCKISVDIGCYQHHPCYHNCLFCYANPASR